MKAKYLKSLLKHPKNRSSIEQLELAVFYSTASMKDFLRWINFEYKLHGV